MRGVAILASVLISVIAVLAAASRNVSLMLQPDIFTGGSSPRAIASAGPPCVPPSSVCDLDGDGKVDLAVANYDTDDVSVLWGNGDGTFTPGASTFRVGTADIESPVAVAIADVNGDGKLDIITANEFAGTVTALLSQGPGTRTFGVAIESPTGTFPEAIAVGDFDGDGKLDAATADFGDDTVTVLLGNGNGTFSILSVCSNNTAQVCRSSSDCPSGGTCNEQPIPVDVGPYALVAVDLDHNGTLDLVVASSGGGPNGNGSLTVLKGVGNGAFDCVAGIDASCSTSAITSSTFDNPVAIVAADLNGDKKPDLVVVSDGSGGGNSALSVLLGNGNLTFQNATALYPGDLGTPEGAVVADLNGDGIPDIASSASFLDKVSVFVGQGNGNFAAPVDFAVPQDSAPWGITAGDFNGDGISDLAVADSTAPGIVSVLLNASVIALAANISATDATITLTEAAALPASGMIMIDGEWIIYTSKQGNTLTNVIRGANGTVAAAHAAGTGVTFIPPTGCVGDCGETGSVSVEDILTVVNVALGNLPAYACLAGDANGDGQITVDEILAAVSNALNGCGA